MDANEIIEKANSRTIGFSCFRETLISLGKIEKSTVNPTRTIKIKSLRYTFQNTSKTFYCACSPIFFKNISFLLLDSKGKVQPYDIYLYIPYGIKLTRKVDSERRFQELLNSDFTYDDFKNWLYVDQQNYLLCNNEGYNDINHFVIENNPKVSFFSKYCLWRKQKFWINPDNFTISKINYYQQLEDKHPFKSVFFDDYKEINGILIHNKMKSINYLNKHETTIELLKCWHNKEIDSSLFEKKSINKLIKYIHSIIP